MFHITEDLKKRTLEIFSEYNFRASPVLDQNFLIDFGVIQRMLRYGKVSKEDTVLEIGPGLGFITEELAKNSGKVITIEKDKRLEPILKDILEKYDNIEFIMQDCLKTDFPKFNKIISHIPFSISAPFTFKLPDYDFDTGVVIYQREFGEKTVAKPGDPKFGRSSVIAQHYFDVELKEVLPRNSFYPQPNIDGCVIVLKKKDVEKDKGFDDFVKEIFRYKNKNVKDAVKIAFGKEIEDEKKVGILKIPEIVEIYKKVKSI